LSRRRRARPFVTGEEADPIVGSVRVGRRPSTGAAVSVATVAVGNAIARGLGFLFPLVVGRVLDRPDFAVILLYISTGFFVAELVLTGFPTALTRYLAAADPRWTPRAVTGAAVAGGLPLLAVCIVAGAILAVNAGLSIALTTVVIAGLTIDAYYFAALRGLGRFRLLVGYRIAANATQLVLLVVLAALDLASVTSAVVLYSLVYLIPIAVIELREPVVTPILPRPADVRAPVVEQMSRFAIPALISGTAFGVIFGLDTYAVGVLAPADLPDYAAARSLVMPMTLVPFAIGVVLMPRIAAATARQRRDLGFALAATVGASVLAVVAYAVLGDWLVALVYPDGFAGAAAFLTPLATALAVMGAYSVVTQWSFGLGESRRPAAAIVIGALVAVVGQIVLTSAYGGTGAAAAIAIGAGVALALLAISDAVRPIRPRGAPPAVGPSGAKP
jgi:O-antigen/teichoic acid export membrane protein